MCSLSKMLKPQSAPAIQSLAPLPKQVEAPVPQDPGVMHSPEDSAAAPGAVIDPSRTKRMRTKMRTDAGGGSLTIPTE